MKTLELILSITALAGLVLFFAGISYSGLILIFSFILLGLLYFLGGWQIFKDKDGNNILWYSLVTGWLLSIVVTANIFILKAYPARNIMLYVGMALICIVLLFTLIKFFKDKKGYKSYYIGIIARSLFVLLMFVSSLVYKYLIIV